MQAQDIIDAGTFSQLKELMGAEFVVELIDTYNSETAELVKQLHQALTAQDAASFGRLAHSIKSSSASMGALDFSQKARELEMMGKANDLAGADLKLLQLAADFLRVRDCLKELRNEP